MTFTYTDIVVTVVIVAVVLFAAHRFGQVNPIGTGKLARRLSAVELKVAEQGEKLDNLDRAMVTLATSSAEISRELQAMRMEMAGDRGLGERTWAAVDRLQAWFMEDAVKNRSSGR